MKDKKKKNRTRLSGKDIQKMVGELGAFVYDEIWDEDAGVKLRDVINALGTVQAIYAIKNCISEEDIQETAEMLAEINRNIAMPIATVMVGMAMQEAQNQQEAQDQDQLQDQPTIH